MLNTKSFPVRPYLLGITCSRPWLPMHRIHRNGIILFQQRGDTPAFGFGRWQQITRKKGKKKRRVCKMRSLFELACCEGDRRPRNPNPPAAPGVWPSDGDAAGTRGSGGCGASRQPDLPSPLGIVASQQQNFLTCFDVSTTLYRSYVVYANMLVVHTS